MSKNKSFKKGTVVVFDPSLFNKKYWDSEPEENRIKYYGDLGYGSDKPKFFVFMCEIRNSPGHCVLVSLDDQKILTMVHTDYLREVTEEEF